MTELAQAGISDNGAAGVAYITPLPAVVFLLAGSYKSKPHIRFHAFQSILLFLAAFVVSIVITLGMVLGTTFGLLRAGVVAPAFWMVWIVVCVICAISALNGKHFKLPVVGAMAERFANN